MNTDVGRTASVMRAVSVMRAINVMRAVSVIAPNDLRLIWRDGFLLSFMALILPIVCLTFSELVPFIGELVAEWVDLEHYYGLILASAIVGGEPVMLGFVIGILFVEERDEGTLLALQASPLSLRVFLDHSLPICSS